MEQVVKILQDFPEVRLVGRNLGSFSEGEEVSLKVWEASLLEERGIAKPVDDFSVVGIRKMLMREQRSSELKKIPSNFYHIISNKIEKLRREEEFEKAEEVKKIIKSLSKIRLQKIARISLSSDSTTDTSYMETFFVNRLNHVLKIWRQRLDRLLEETYKEEVGAHKGGIRRSIPRVVENTADI